MELNNFRMTIMQLEGGKNELSRMNESLNYKQKEI
jgi:hypothetical protein